MSFNTKKGGVNNVVVPSDAQAREKLAVYVYEYLVHMGAKNTAETFLQEIRWNKTNMAVGEAPGFLHSWWSVFWDLYCAAPERRDAHEHSGEARMFHDYGIVNSGYPAVNGIAQNATLSPLPLPPQGPGSDMPPGGGHPAGFFPGGVPPNSLRPSPPQQPVSQPSPHSMMPNQGPQFMRFPSPRPVMRMSSEPHGAPGPSMFPPEAAMMRGPGMSPLHRLPPGQRMPLNHNGFRHIPPGSAGSGPQLRNWPPNTSTIHYSEPSPGGQYHGPVMLTNGPPPGPGTPIMHQSPQSLPDGQEPLYIMKPPGSAGPLPPGYHTMTSESISMSEMLVLNGDPNMDIKSSPIGSQTSGLVPASTPGPPGSVSQQGPGSSETLSQDYMSNPFQNDDSSVAETEAIMKIKESLGEEAKQFEKPDTPSGSQPAGNGRPSSSGSQSYAQF